MWRWNGPVNQAHETHTLRQGKEGVAYELAPRICRGGQHNIRLRGLFYRLLFGFLPAPMNESACEPDCYICVLRWAANFAVHGENHRAYIPGAFMYCGSGPSTWMRRNKFLVFGFCPRGKKNWERRHERRATETAWREIDQVVGPTGMESKCDCGNSEEARSPTFLTILYLRLSRGSRIRSFSYLF